MISGYYQVMIYWSLLPKQHTWLSLLERGAALVESNKEVQSKMRG